MQLFHDVANHIECQPLNDWRAKNRPVVGYTCSQVPAEIFYAAGILPMRLRGIETDGMDIGDAYYGPFICSFPKCLLQLAGKGAFKFVDGVVITPGCDAMRRLDECWRKAGEDYQGIIPDFFYYFDVPHKAEGHGMEWFVEEIEYLIAEIEDHFSVEITDAKLREAIAEYNKGRRLLDEIEAIRSAEGGTVSGTDMFAATIAGTVMPRALYNAQLEQWLKSLKEQPPAENARKRIMLIGSITDDVDLFRLIEFGTDAVVVSENLCFGVRSEGRPVDEAGNPIGALAEHYLGESACPRMYGRHKQRLAVLQEKIEQSKIDGVIMQNIRFCDLHGAENALFEKALEAQGIPCLRLEREYGPMIDKGRLKLRINAFLERLGRRRQYARSN